MKIILDDIACKEDLYPFTLTRSVADIRVGILTIREKWEALLGKKINTLSELHHREVKTDEKLVSNKSVAVIKQLANSTCSQIKLGGK